MIAPASPATVTADQYRGGNTGAEGAAVEFVERVGGEPHGEEEGQERGEQPGQLDAWGQRGADHHIRQVPGRVRGVQQGPPVPPSAGTGGIEGGAAFYPAGTSLTAPGAPHHQTTAEAHDARPDVLEAGPAPGVLGPGQWVLLVVP